MPFKELEAIPDFPQKEQEILKWWYESGVVQKYLHKNDASKKRFSFLDGPITANNPMGVHHAWGRSLKDFFQRYQNMQGAKQRFQNGFDNQGLWVEVEVEKELKFRSKKDIENYGIDKFVEKCKEHTLKFAKIQTEQSERLGYFMDWDNSYYTLSDENNYAIWHFLKKVWQDGNLYKGRDSVPWCPRCGTAISQHEILTEEYQELTHKAITIEYPLKDQNNHYLLVWTTTPWTLPANVSVAVNPKFTYVQFETESGTFYSTENYMKITAPNAKNVKKISGTKLIGKKYIGLFDNLPAVSRVLKEKPKHEHQIIPWQDISEEEGTGLVHIAPGAGAEDFSLSREFNLPVLGLLDEAGVYLEGYGEFSGHPASEVSRLVIDCLGKEDRVWLVEDYTHRYPVCWRCKTELLWRVVEEWYIAMDDQRQPGAKNYRGRLIEVITDVKWIPPFGYERELDWLKNMEDWLISKKRYWGLALPIWQCLNCGKFEIIGSKEELKARAVKGWGKFAGNSPHRPWVDEVKIKCQACGQLANRILDVGNPWLDAGIVSFSTLKYFNDNAYWQKWFPADLVLESFPGQFKNWFYSLLAMSVVLEDRAPFKTLFGHAQVLDEKGQEMHKSKGNAIWFDDAAEKMGVDIMRWLYLGQNPEIDLRFGYTPAETVRRRFFLILWNVYKFFVTYANLDGWQPDSGYTRNRVTPGIGLHPESGYTRNRVKPSASVSLLDQWILSKLQSLIKIVTNSLDNYDTPIATSALEDFVVKDLSTWYIRRSRERVGPTVADLQDKDSFYQTSYEVLITLVRLLAPFIPFLTEEVYQNLKLEDDPESVHLTNWPKFDRNLIDERLGEQMDLVREIVEKGHAVRKEKNIKVRQPLRKITVKFSKNVAAPFYGAPKESEQAAQSAVATELIKLVQDELNVKEVELIKSDETELTVEFDTTLSQDLILEGMAREVVREAQSLRAKTGVSYGEEITLYYQTDSHQIKKALHEFKDYIESQTLSNLYETKEVKLGGTIAESQIKIDDSSIWLTVAASSPNS